MSRDDKFRQELFWEILCDTFVCDVQFTARDVYAKLTPRDLMRLFANGEDTGSLYARTKIGRWLSTLESETKDLVLVKTHPHTYVLPSVEADDAPEI